jgi:tellurite resistance protein
VSSALAPYALDAARTLVAVFLALTVLLGSWITGQWIVESIDQDAANPSFFLPAAAGGLVGAFAAAQVGMHAIAEASFGIGILCWIFFGSLLYSRLFFRPTMPTPLLPALAIELAPPVVAGVAYFALSKGRIDTFATGLAGFSVLMALVQLRLIPLYAKLHFSPTIWAFTFPYAAAASDALLWIRAKQPAGATAYAAVTVGLITFFIGVIAVFTVAALARGTFLTPPRKDLRPETTGPIGRA